jgi:hypothetical protein
MDAVDLQVRHIAFIHDEMWHVENNEERHSSERKQARVVRKATEQLLGE